MSGSERARTAEFGRGARTVSIGIAATGLVTAAYFAMASHALPGAQYSQLALLWSVLFVVISVIYRPIEQLLARTIASRRAAGLYRGHPLRAIAGIEAGLATVVVVLALVLRGPLQDNLLDGSATLYWILVAGVALYGASYFARGWLSGHKWFGLYGGLVLLESCSRALFALAVTVGAASGVDVVALGIVAAPVVSLFVVPVAFLRHRGQADDRGDVGAEVQAEVEVAAEADGAAEFTLSHGVAFATSVVGVMLAEQALLNAPVLAVNATSSDAVLAGVVFNIFLVVRAPLTLFQSVQTSLLPHLSGLAPGDRAFGHAVRTTLAAIGAFTLAVALGLLLLGPAVMRIVFGDEGSYARGGLALVGLAMGFHLAASTFTQAALARGRAVAVAAAWLLVAAIFVAWMLSPIVGDEVLRAEVGYLGAAAVLAAALALLDRRAGSA